MKKKLAILLLSLAALVGAAACSSSGKSYKPVTPETFDNWAQSRHVAR
jgi:ABC-type glycerol-3-phosphate transport system substrate-binding protein